MSDRVLVEICVDDLDGALAAERGGADRIELCADLLEGGTTPSAGLLAAVLGAVTRVGVQVMVRPRGGSFTWSDTEVEVMCADIAHVVEVARDSRVPVGIVLGALDATGALDVAVMGRLVAAAGSLPVTCHKAVDEVADLDAAYETLRELGVVRVLTSGGAPTAQEGATALTRLVARSTGPTGGPAVLAGGSVRAASVGALVRATGVREVHLRAQRPSVRGDGTLETDVALVRELVAVVRGLADEQPFVTSVSAVDVAPDRRAVLAVDVGGTTLKGAVVDACGRSVVVRSVPSGGTGEESVARLVDLLRGLREAAGSRGLTVLGAGVATPGMVDAEAGVVRYASTLRWTDLALGPLLTVELGLPVAIGHDVRSAGLAESLFGASADVADSVLVSIGTGVAASILSGGHPVTGDQTTAGELGHIPAVPGGEACTCGQSGCLEVYLSGAGLARRYAAHGGTPGLDAAAISRRLDDDPVAAAVWADGVRALGLGLASLTLLVDPRVIVLTGGVSRAGDLLLDPLRAELASSLAWRAAPQLRGSLLGTTGGRIGAAVLAFRAAGLGSVVGSWSVADLVAD